MLRSFPPAPDRRAPAALARAPLGRRTARPAAAGAALAALLALGLATAPAIAPAAESGANPTSTGSSRTKNRNSTARGPRDAPSSESRAERDRRLMRECQGRPNAGACLGYAR